MKVWRVQYLVLLRKRTTVNQMLYRITHFKRLFIRKWLERKGNYEKFKPIAHDLL